MATRQWQFILAIIMAAEILSGLESMMALAALTSWVRIYNDVVGVGWIITAYMLVAAAAAAICGRLGDLYGRKRVLLVVIAAAVTGSVVSAVAPTLEMVIAGRAIQGLSGAIIPLCYGLVRQHLPAGKVSFGIGMIVATASLSSAAGLLIGGYLTDHFHPQSIFVVSALFGVAIFFIVAIFLPASTVDASRRVAIDWLGGILFVPGIMLLLFLAGNLARWDFASPRPLVLLATGIAILSWWVIHERRHRNPLIDMALLANRDTFLANIVMGCTALGAMQTTQLVAMLLQQPVWTGAGLGTSASFVGVLKLPAILLGAVCSIVAGIAAGRFGGRAPILFGAIVMTAGALLGMMEINSLPIMFVAVALSTIGVTAIFTGVPNVIVAVCPPDRTSEAVGMMSVFRAVCQAAGAQFLVIILASSTIASQDAIQYPDAQAYRLAFGLMAGASFAAFLCALGLSRKAVNETEATLAPAKQ